ncbi:MAG: hypothetical protein ACI81R_003835 [Bradymonadia bacterium]|jgi:hypothetical protein
MRRELVTALACVALGLPLAGCDCSGSDAPAAGTAVSSTVDAGLADAGLADVGVGRGADTVDQAGPSPTSQIPRTTQSGAAPVESGVARPPDAPPVSDQSVGTDYADLIEHFAQTQLAQGIHNCRDRLSFDGKVNTVVIRVSASRTREVVAVGSYDGSDTTALSACLTAALGSMRLPVNPSTRESRDSKNGLATITALPEAAYQVEFRFPDSK